MLIIAGLHLFHDIWLLDGETSIDIDVAGKLFQNCYESDDVLEVLFNFLMATTQKHAGLNQLTGIGKKIGGSLDTFGPWSLPPFRFLALWSQFETEFNEKDLQGICKFVKFAINRRAYWKKDHYAVYCLLSRNLVCPVSLNLETVHSRDECLAIFQAFPEKGRMGG
jgi:hypothetical protein